MLPPLPLTVVTMLTSRWITALPEEKLVLIATIPTISGRCAGHPKAVTAAISQHKETQDPDQTSSKMLTLQEILQIMRKMTTTYLCVQVR